MSFRDKLDDEDLSFDDIEQIREYAEGSVSQTDGELTPGECQMARDYSADGLSDEEIAEQFPIDQRKLTPHLLGFCDCDRKRGESR